MTMRYLYQFEDFLSTIECSPVQLKIGDGFSLVLHNSNTEFNNNLNGLTNNPAEYFRVPPMIFNFYYPVCFTANL